MPLYLGCVLPRLLLLVRVRSVPGLPQLCPPARAAAMFLHSFDAGSTWTITNTGTTFAGYECFDISIVDETHAFAAMMSGISQTSGIAAYS